MRRRRKVKCEGSPLRTSSPACPRFTHSRDVIIDHRRTSLLYSTWNQRCTVDARVCSARCCQNFFSTNVHRAMPFWSWVLNSRFYVRSKGVTSKEERRGEEIERGESSLVFDVQEDSHSFSIWIACLRINDRNTRCIGVNDVTKQNPIPSSKNPRTVLINCTINAKPCVLFSTECRRADPGREACPRGTIHILKIKSTEYVVPYSLCQNGNKQTSKHAKNHLPFFSHLRRPHKFHFEQLCKQPTSKTKAKTAIKNLLQ